MDPVKVWGLVLSEIELKVTRPMFTAFFSKTRLESLNNSTAVVLVNNPLIKEIIASRYYSIIEDLLKKHTHQRLHLVFKVGREIKQYEEPGPLFSQTKEDGFAQSVKRSHLNPLYNFENFAVSSSNQMAYAAARAVSQSPGKAYNPLFLYGGVGVGKTHLMQAIGIELLKKVSEVKIIFCTGEEFTNEIIEAIRSKNTYRFKDKFRSVHMLLIDDVQFIAGKNAVQEEFFYTFNAIYRRGSQIVFTSDRSPSEISKLEERLRSRFEGGLLIDIQLPDFELRTAIVLIKAKQRGVSLPMNVAQGLATQVSDARRLEGSLIRLITEAQVRKEPITLELVHRLFGKSNKPFLPTNNTVSPAVFITAVSKHFGVKTSLLKGERRSRPIVVPRQILMFLLRTELGLSLNEIGSFLGGRDHTTILHGIEKISLLLTTNKEIQNDVLAIKNFIGSKQFSTYPHFY